MQASQVNVYQKLVIVKDMDTGKKSQYILTLIPTPSYAARHASGIAENFVNCGEKDGYSGLAVYTRVYTPITAHVSRYKDGRRIQKVFLLDANLKSGELRNAVELARSMTASISIQRGKVAMTRYEDDWGWDIDGGGFPEVVITPDDDYNDNDEPDWDSWLEENRHDDNVEPEESMPTEDTAEDQDTSRNNDNDQESQENEAIEKAKNELVKMGVDLSGIKIIKGQGHGANASKGENGTIVVYQNFYSWETKTQVAILWHEIYHIRNDKPTTGEILEKVSKIEVQPPQDISEKIMSLIESQCPNCLDYAIQEMYKQDISFEYIYDPTFLQNEINCYNAEKENFPDNSVEKEYADLRDVNL